MRNDRDYKAYKDETTIIEGFEELERDNGTDYGSYYEDFIDWYKLYRAGFIAGGNS